MLQLALDSLNIKVVMRMLLLALMLFLSEHCINYDQVVLNILMTRGILEQEHVWTLF